MLHKGVWLLLLLCSLAGHAQDIVPRFETLGVEQGLSQSSVYSIYQDRKGYMWFGTADGLNRYDGSSIRVFKMDAAISKEGSSNYIRGNIAEDKLGNIWYSNETGIYYYSPLSDAIKMAYSFSKKEWGGYLFELVGFDSKGMLWLCNPIFGIASFDVQKGSLAMNRFSASVENDRINYSETEIDAEGKIWLMVSRKQGVICFDTRTTTFLPNAQQPLCHRRMVTNGWVYTLRITENFSVAELNLQPKGGQPKKITSITSLTGNDMTVIKMHADYLGRIWMSTMNGGVIMFNPKTNKLQQFTHDNSKQKSLPINFTRTFFEDSQHNLWIGTDGGGVCKIDLKPPMFNLFPLNEGDYPTLKDYFIKCFFEDDERNTWFGTLSNGICKLDNHTGKLSIIGSDKPRPGKFCTALTGCIFKDSKGIIWAGSSMGVGIYNKAKNDFDPIKMDSRFLLQPYNIFVYQIAELHDGTYLAATSYGLVHITKNKTGSYEMMLEENQPMRAGQATSVVCLGKDIWSSFPINGLSHFTYENGKFSFVERFFVNTDLRGITKDAEDSNILWVASGIGLIRMNSTTKQYQVFNSNHGLKNSYVYGILEDGQHNLWMGTNGGIAVFNKKANRFTSNFTSNDGLQSNEFNTGAYHKGKSGMLYFGGIKGFNWFNPSAINPLNRPPNVSIAGFWINDSMLVNDSAYHFHHSIKLNHDRNDIAMQLAVLDFTKPEANKVQYQLLNWDEQPIVTYNKNVRYSNLSPGHYTFTVRASNVNGTWGEPVSIYITIEPPFWKTWWFYLLVSCTVVVSIALIVRYIYLTELKQKIKELEKQKALEDERQRISREMHDDIGAGLTQISLMSEAARKGSSANYELEDIASTSRKLVGNMGEIIWSLNVDNSSMEQVNAYLREQLHKQLEYTGIEYSIQLDESQPNLILGNQQKRNLLLVTKELVNNAIKYSRAKKISINSRLQDDALSLEVKDDGTGFDVAVASKGNGLRNIRHRVEELGGNLQLTSSNKGTVCHYSIPLK